jgi:hypothetical protein
MKDPRVAKCLEAKRESRAIEFKEEFDPANVQQSLEFLKDIVAIANSGGGALAIGINNGGEGCKTDVKRVLNHDHAKYCDLIKKYTMQDFCDFEVIEAKKDGHSVAIFLINPPDAPLVFEKPGTYAIENNKQRTAFSQGTVYFRHGAKSETGTTDDLSKFIQQRVREMRTEVFKGMRRVTEAPRGAQLHVVPKGSEIEIVPRGTTAPSLASAVPVRLTSDPSAPSITVVDRHSIFPYRQKELIVRLREALPDGPIPNTYDMLAINRIYHISEEHNLSWKPQYSPRQYGEGFVEWFVDQIAKDKNFLTETRRRFKEMNQTDR